MLEKWQVLLAIPLRPTVSADYHALSSQRALTPPATPRSAHHDCCNDDVVATASSVATGIHVPTALLEQDGRSHSAHPALCRFALLPAFGVTVHMQGAEFALKSRGRRRHLLSAHVTALADEGREGLGRENDHGVEEPAVCSVCGSSAAGMVKGERTLWTMKYADA